jgi:hypothetical protein
MFVDLGTGFNRVFQGTEDDFSADEEQKYQLVKYKNYTTGNSITNPYDLLNKVGTTPISYEVFAYIDAINNPLEIAAYQIIENKAVLIDGFERSPITDINVASCNPCTDSNGVNYTSTHTKPLMKLTIGAAGANATSMQSAVIGIRKNCNWINEARCIGTNVPIYLHGVDVNNAVPAMAKVINSYQDYISDKYNNNYSLEVSYQCITQANTTKIIDQVVMIDYITNVLGGTFVGTSSFGDNLLFKFTDAQNRTLFTNYQQYFEYNTGTYTSCQQKILQKQNCPTGNDFYDCSGFNNANNPFLINSGYISGIEFLNKNSMNDISNQYYRGGSTLCADTKNYSNLMPNNSILAKVPSGSNAASTYQSDRIIPEPSKESLTKASYVPENKICYSGRSAPVMCNYGALCCDNCSSNRIKDSCTDANATDISTLINQATEAQRVKLPWEMPALPLIPASLNYLCVPIPLPSPCRAISNGANVDGFASWSGTDAGKKDVAGVCKDRYIGNPTRTCYPVGDAGVWGPVKNPCVERAAACRGDTTYNDPRNAPPHATAVYTNGELSFTCASCYNNNITVSCNQQTRKWEVAGICAPQQCQHSFTVINGNTQTNMTKGIDVNTDNTTTSDPFDMCFNSGCSQNTKKVSCTCNNGALVLEITGVCYWSNKCNGQTYGTSCYHRDMEDFNEGSRSRFTFYYDGLWIKNKTNGNYCSW